jgi:hypothetical protein
MKNETERRFRKEVLPRLSIYWMYKNRARSSQSVVETLKVSARLDDQVSRENPDRAYFKLRMVGPYLPGGVEGFRSEIERANLLELILNCKDSTALSRSEVQHDHFSDLHRMHMSIGDSDGLQRHLNNPEISDLQLHLKPMNDVPDHNAWGAHCDISFGWQKVVTKFFAEEVYVRRRMKEGGDVMKVPPTLAKLFAETKAAIFSRCLSLGAGRTSTPGRTLSLTDMSSHRQEQSMYYTKAKQAYMLRYDNFYRSAYKARLYKAYAEIGVLFRSEVVADTVEKRVRSHIHTFREAKEDSIRILAESIWNREFGGVQFEEKDDGAEDDDDYS